jgi:short-subunit dehydrogenase
VLNTIHPLIESMKKRRRGQIAILSSLAGICPLPGAASYSASKAAVRYYGDALRGALAPYNVHVSVICPGWITTPLTEKNHFPMPFIMSAARAATLVIHSLAQKKGRIAFPRRLYFPLLLLSALPISVLELLMRKLPKKRLKP